MQVIAKASENAKLYGGIYESLFYMIYHVYQIKNKIYCIRSAHCVYIFIYACTDTQF